MSSVQERLQMKRVPLDKWSVREQLCLASAVECSGDQNWMSVSRSLKMLAACGPPGGGGSAAGQPANRPSDWFSQKFCAAQYGKLLENVETPKRKKRADLKATADKADPTGGAGLGAAATVSGTVETPGESILRKLTHERMSELNRMMLEDQREHDRLRDEIALVQATTDEAELRRIWQQIEAEQRQQERDAAQHAHWLKEREARKLEQERAWRPTVTVVCSASTASSASASVASVATGVAVQQQQQQQQLYAHKVSAMAAIATTSAASAAAIAETAPPPRAQPTDDIVVIEDMDIDEDCSPKSDPSPLLTSLLKSPTASAVALPPTPTLPTPPLPPPSSQSLCTVVPSTATSRVAPTITNLLTGGHKPLPHLSIAATSLPSIVPTVGNQALLAQSLTGPAPIAGGHFGSAIGGGSGLPTPPVQSPSQAAPTLSMLLENRTKEQAKPAVHPLPSATQQQPPAKLPAFIATPTPTLSRQSPLVALVPLAAQPSVSQPTATAAATPPAPPAKPAAVASAAAVDVLIDDDDQLLLDEFSGLIPDNIDELLTDANSAIMLDADQLLTEAADSMLDTVESLLAAGEADAETAAAAEAEAEVVATETATTKPTLAGESQTPMSAVVEADVAAGAVAAAANDDDDEADDVRMAAELGDANEPIIDVAAARAAVNAGGDGNAGELMTTAELVEQLTSSQPSSVLAAGFPLNVPPLLATRTTPVPANPANLADGNAADNKNGDDDDNDDDVLLIEAAIKADRLAETKSSTVDEPAMPVTNTVMVSAHSPEPPAAAIADTEENSQDGMGGASPVASTAGSTKPSAPSPFTKDDDQSSSSNDAPLSELLKDRHRRTETKSPAAAVVVAAAAKPVTPVTVEEAADVVTAEPPAAAADEDNEDDNDDDGGGGSGGSGGGGSGGDGALDDSPKGSVRTDVFESDSNDDKCLEIIKREIHELTGLKENESSENSNEASSAAAAAAATLAIKVEAEPLKAEKPSVDSVIEPKEEPIETAETPNAEQDEDTETIEAILSEMEKTEEKTYADGDVLPPAPSIDGTGVIEALSTADTGEPMSDTDDEVMATAGVDVTTAAASVATLAATLAADEAADADDEDAAADDAESKDDAPSVGRRSPLALPFEAGAAAAAAADETGSETTMHVDDTEDEDQPASVSDQRPTRFGGRSANWRTSAGSSSKALATGKAATPRRRPSAEQPQPPSDTDSSASHRSQTASSTAVNAGGGRQTRRRLRGAGGDADRDRSESPGQLGLAAVADGVRTPGDTDSETRASRSKRRISSATGLLLLDSTPASPASTASTGAVSATSSDYRSWKNSIHLVLNRIGEHRHAGPFRRPIADERAAADYRTIVLRPMDLQTLRRNVDAGLVRTTAEVQRDVMLMCSNAVWHGVGGSATSTAAARLSARERRKRVQLAVEMQADALHCIEAIMEVTWRPEQEQKQTTAETPTGKQMAKPSGIAGAGASTSAGGQTTTTTTTTTSSASKMQRGRKCHRLPPAT